MTLWLNRSIAEMATLTRAPAVLALGVFDGLHRGHQVVLDRAADVGASLGLPWGVFSFWTHPLSVLAPHAAPTQWLTPPLERVSALLARGASHIVMPPFDAALQTMPADVFVDQVLVSSLGVAHLVVGEGFCFGAQRVGSVAWLNDYAHATQRPIRAEAVALTCNGQGEKIGSSGIRQCLQEAGDVTTAAHALGRPYAVTGRIRRGDQRGRQWGIPTANLQVSPLKLLPQNGVYVVSAQLTSECDTWLPAVCNVGLRPTVAGQNAQSVGVEVHLLDGVFREPGSLYDQGLTIRFHHRLRAEQAFASTGALIDQIRQDIANTQAWFKAQPAALAP
jgi:riboflavin kinase / FMN adenylyltransferase